MKKFTQFNNTKDAVRTVQKAINSGNYSFDGEQLARVGVRQKGGKTHLKPKYSAETLVLVGGNREEGVQEVERVLSNFTSASLDATYLEVQGYSETYESNVTVRFHEHRNLTGKLSYIVEFLGKEYNQNHYVQA